MRDINIPLKYRIRTADKEKNSRSIFLLHGFGSHMDDLFSLNQFFPPDWTIVSLQAPISMGFGGWAWAQIDFSNIRTILNEVIEEHMTAKDISQVGMRLMKFCAKWDMQRVADQATHFAEPLNARYPQ